MKRLLIAVTLVLSVFAVSQESKEEPGHVHGADGRHIVAPQQTGSSDQKIILSHHDMRIEGADGKTILGAKVSSNIFRKDDPSKSIHTEENAYEPENEVYGSHMTYKEAGEFVIDQDVTLPGGKKVRVKFPVFVSVAGSNAALEEEHAHGPNWILIFGGPLAAIVLLYGVYRMGQKKARIVGAGLLIISLVGTTSMIQVAHGQEDEKGHVHGADGRHIVAPDAEKSSGPSFKAFPAPNQGESAEQTIDGIKYKLSIENEEMTPDPELVSVNARDAKLVGLKTALVESSETAGGLQSTGVISADPNGMVNVNARTSGRIVSLGALPGTHIEKGQVLAVIESADLAEAQSAYRKASAEVQQGQASVKISDSGIRAAETRLQISNRNLVLQKQLVATGVFASPSLELARSKVSTSESLVKSARSELDRVNSLVKKLELGVASGVVARRELETARAEATSANAKVLDSESQLVIEKQALAREESISRKGLRNAKEIESAQAEVDLARITLSSSRNQMLQSKADLARIQSGVRVALDKIRLLGGTPTGGNRISVTSPISCEVEKRFVSVGQTVATGQELYELLNADIVWVLADVYEKDIPKVQIGQSVRVVADALPSLFYEGEVAFIHNEVDEKTRTTKVRVVVDNPGEKLKQNMFVRVALGTTKGVQILVPTSAIQKSAGLDVVFVEEVSGTYRRTIVQVQGSLGDRTIVKGVESGKRVVTEGSYQLLALGGGK